MKINLIEVPTPMFSEMQLFANPDLELLKEKKTIRVSVRQKTKTRISTSMTLGKACVRINFPMEGFKTHSESSLNYGTCENESSDYFVKSAKQDLNVYKEYLKKVIEHIVKDIFKVELDEITIELEAKNF
jgi:hypothetical protein